MNASFSKLLKVLMLFTSIYATALNVTELLPLTRDLDVVVESLKKYPSLLFLAHHRVAVTEEGQSRMNKARYSIKRFGQAYDEFDRTMTSLHCLQMIDKGDKASYDQFVKGQIITHRSQLSYLDFQKLRKQLNEAQQLSGLDKKEYMALLGVGIVISDLGKSEAFRQAHPDVKQEADHDNFLLALVRKLRQHPNAIPAFSQLTPPAKTLLLDALQAPHYGHFLHLEGGAEILLPLQSHAMTNAVFKLSLLLHALDIAGAQGHALSGTALAYSSYVHQTLFLLRRCGERIVTHNGSIDEAYSAYLSERGKDLGIDSIHGARERVLVRLGCMMRLFSLEEGKVLINAFNALPKDVQAQALHHLDFVDINLNRVTPTYMPAVLINLINNPTLGKSKTMRLKQAVTLGVPLLLRGLKFADQVDKGVPLCFNAIAAKAKSLHLKSTVNQPITVNNTTGLLKLVEL